MIEGSDSTAKSTGVTPLPGTRSELTVTSLQRDTTVGSTVVALLLEDNRVACVWAGDSRCYLWRQRRLYQLSRDHSLLEHLVTHQHLSFEQASQHPSAAALTRAVGGCEHLALDVLELQVQPDDVFLLCSDGLYQSLSSETVIRALTRPYPQEALDLLFEQALRGPAQDNLTAVVVRR